MSTLQQQIEARKKEAHDKQIEEKARVVARHLGTDHRPFEGVFCSYESDDLSITFQDKHLISSVSIAASGTIITYEGKIVYQCSSERAPGPSGAWEEIGITCFIPGKWEKLLEELYQSALPKAEAGRTSEYRERKRRDREAEAKIRAKWGL